MTLFLLRHGQTAWSEAGRFTGRTDVPLTAAGMAEAARAADRLDAAGLVSADTVWVSPARRCRQTLEVLAGRHPLPTEHVEPRLVELDFGPAEGWTRAQLDARWPGSNFWQHCPPGAEPIAEVERRLAPLLPLMLEHAAAASDGLVVGHGYALRALLAMLLGDAASAGERFGIASASFAEVRVVHGRPRLEL